MACSVLISLVAASMAMAGPILNPTQESLRWPYQKLDQSAHHLTQDTSLEDQVNEAHRRYRDSVFFDGVYSVYNPNFFRSDQYLPQNIGDVWVRSSGDWSSILITSNVPDRPVGVFGTQIIYDNFNNTPGLIQYTKIDWGNWPFSIRITHVADVKISFPYERRFEDYRSDSWGSRSIPSPGALILLGAGAWYAGMIRSRRATP